MNRAAQLTALVAALALGACFLPGSPETIVVPGTDATVDPDAATTDVLECPVMQTGCNGRCTDTNNDPRNCGACGSTCSNLGGTGVCFNGMCRSVCDPGFADCDNSNTNGCESESAVDSMNCGMCMRACGEMAVCRGGMCECEAGLTRCGGACVNTQVNPMHCGTCGRVCGAGTPLCSNGACASSCPSGFMNCSGGCADTMNNPMNCGRCGMVCSGGQICSAGRCVCPSGQMLCGGRCVNAQSDSMNCGTCGRACSNGYTCASGVCACVPPRTMSCGRGTCVLLSSDPDNCGACGRECATLQRCSSGTCMSLVITTGG